jgi:hypothetical protein
VKPYRAIEGSIAPGPGATPPLGTAYLIAFNNPPVALTGTALIIVAG